jgi:hypothetical protein
MQRGEPIALSQGERFRRELDSFDGTGSATPSPLLANAVNRQVC